MLNQSTLIFSLYASVAGALTVATGRKLVIQLQSEHKDLMHIACRIGILLLTVGTLLDNARTMFGTIELIEILLFDIFTSPSPISDDRPLPNPFFDLNGLIMLHSPLFYLDLKIHL